MSTAPSNPYAACEPYTSVEGISPDAAAIAAFLRALPHEGFVVGLLNPEAKRMLAFSFGRADIDANAAGIAKANAGGWNAYFRPNAYERTFSGGSHPDKADVRSGLLVHIDADAPKDLTTDEARLAWCEAKARELEADGASLVWFTGGGVQAAKLLREPITLGEAALAHEEFEEVNVAWASARGGDKCHDCSHLLRIPGSVNWPDARKRKRGRVPALARLLAHHPESRVDWASLPRETPKAKATAKGDTASASIDAASVKRLQHPDELGSGVSDSVKVYISNGENPQEPGHFPSRSEMLYWVTLELVRSGIAPEVIYSLLTDPKFKVSESVLEKGRGADRYARRQIDRATAEVANEAADFEESDGKKLPSQHNARVFLNREGVRIRYDEFADRFLIDGLGGFGPHFDDKASTRLRLLARSKYHLWISKEDWSDFLTDLALYQRFHPVRDYLDSLVWDETPRIDRWLVEFGQAADSEYVRAVGPLVLIAAVRRIMEPGCKFDEMLVLEGLQGKNKSTALGILAVREEWFSDDLPLDADTKRFIEAIAGKWIIEAGELKGMRKGEVDALKSTLSRRSDRARLAYGRHPVEIPRKCIIIGSTNSEHYLKDSTGNRRFWPVRCGEFDVEGLRRVRDQLWAEARVREARGESIRLAPRLYPAAGMEQEARRLADPFEEALEVHLGQRTGKVRAHDVWTIIGKADVGRRSQEDANRLGEVMRRLGWERIKRRFGNGPEWAYVRGSKAEREESLFVQTNEAGEVTSVDLLPDYSAITEGGGA